MKVALIIIYLLGGILLNIFGEWAEMIKSDVKNLKRSPADDHENEIPKNQRIKFIIAELIIRLLIVVFFPVALFIMIIDHVRGVKRGKSFVPFNDKTIEEDITTERDEKKKALIENRSFLFFKDTHGGGLIICHGCGFTQEIIGFTHGFDDPCPFSEGNQCQSCGKFLEIDFLGDKRVSSEKCSCGGKLSREEPIFCPKCKARDVSYQLKYVT
jgi:hypothetical protein